MCAMRWRPRALRLSSSTTPSSSSAMRCTVGSIFSQASSAVSGAGRVRKKAMAGVSMARMLAMSKLPGFMMLAIEKIGPALGMAFHQAVEHVHVAEHQAGLLGRHHDVFAAQLLAGAGGHEQRDDLVEILGGALAEIAGARVGVGQAEFGLLAFRPMPGSTRPSATTTPSSPSTGSRRSPLVGSALPRGAPGLLLRTAKQEDRGDQQQAGGQDADAQQCRVGHSIGSPASSFR
jgi:hypothetical protein